MNDAGVDTRVLLNGQAGKIQWPGLMRHFARGKLICLEGELDLIEVADLLVKDQAGQIASLYRDGKLRRALDDDAIRWEAEGTEFWAVVVAPWVLVQEI